jgi:hypothetical protein
VSGWRLSVANPYVVAITAELRRLDVKFHFEKGGKHPRVVMDHNGKCQFYVFPGSGMSGAHGIRNCISDIRRLLGVPAPARGKSGMRKCRAARLDDAPVLPDSFVVRPDPFLVLLALKPPASQPAVTAKPTSSNYNSRS